MIKCEGIKAFHGSATIRPKTDKVAPFEVEGDWVYKPETGCWYCGGRSFAEDIVTGIRERPEHEELINELQAKLVAIDTIAVTTENTSEIRELVWNALEKMYDIKKEMGCYDE